MIVIPADSRTTARAHCDAARTWRIRWLDDVAARPSCPAARRRRRASGATPESTRRISAHVPAAMAENASTGRLRVMSASVGSKSAGARRVNVRSSSAVRPMPSSPPQTPSTMLSATSCCTTARDEAPIAERIASSRRRTVPRATRRFGDVRTGHQHQRRDAGKKQPERRGRRIRNEALLQRVDGAMVRPCSFGSRSSRVVSSAAICSLACSRSDLCGLEPPRNEQPLLPLCRQGQGNPQPVEVLVALAGAHDADDRVWRAIDSKLGDRQSSRHSRTAACHSR